MGESLVKEKAKIFLYCKNLGSSTSSSVPIAAQHWAVVVSYLDDDGEVDRSELYHANNGPPSGYLVASNEPFSKKKSKEWMAKIGASNRFLGDRTLSQDQAIAYCQEVTDRKEKYSALEKNCQKFVHEFITHVTVEGKMNLPTNAEAQKTFWGFITSTSLNSVSNLSSATVVKELILKQISIRGAGDIAFKKAVESATAQGMGKISLLVESPLKEWIKETGKNLVLSASGEITENMLNACRGAFTWWNLLQIPVEMITKSILKNRGFSKIASYGGSKLASVLTAAGVGVFAGGPIGLAASVGFWIATEIAVYLIRKILEWGFGDKYTAIFGESQTEGLVKAMYEWFKTKIELGMTYGIQWMIDYIYADEKQKKMA